MSKGSMKILRKLPDAPTPTKPYRSNSRGKETITSAIDDADPIEVEPKKKLSEVQKKAAARARGLATINEARAKSIENARRRALPVLELYKNEATIDEIVTATGIPKRTVQGIIGRYIKSGEVKVVFSHEDKRLAALYNEGLSYEEMSAMLHLTGGALSSKLYRIRRLGLIGKRKG